ncbi:hypothetical protein CC86DRAFT_445792 [Ophiobolus disseminans]|uniref:Uncharacterized protein n=1 Tax=Ophiobolus disseminans TaxID=1469910 RepID=A0A6A7A0L5_9PLEO|nr:hypothetical protein CC86DRAFT_445792 [Ophiobolus disseminans]
MTGSAAFTREASTITVRTGDLNPKNTFVSRCTEIHGSNPKNWKPLALRTPVLIFTIAICWSLIALLEFLLFRSQRDNGLIFAPKINDLPLSRTFLYLYFPTILAVIFSIYWSWIDLETKRMEPYYQLSKENGALGKDSLLLQYPFSFIPLVPFRAFKDRHWPVFWASLTVVLVTWGVVPTQAGIFSIRSVTITTNMTFAIPTSSMPVDRQPGSLRLYPQSTYGIAALNETLPPYMARNYTLAPFQSDDEGSVFADGTYTAPTTMYSLNLDCEEAIPKYFTKLSSQGSKNVTTLYSHSSTNGCTVAAGKLDGNLTIGEDSAGSTGITSIKQYTGQYIGYHSGERADYYLSSRCPESENTTFYAAFAKSKIRAEDPPQKSTAVFCQARYWRQEVSATVDTETKAPLRTEPLAPRQPLEWHVFNTTSFETYLSANTFGYQKFVDNRQGNKIVPGASAPKYWDLVAETNLSITSGSGSFLPPMTGLAIGIGTRPWEDYLDWRILSTAYADAYRLIFARAMVDVLNFGSPQTKKVQGLQTITTEAVVLEPVFVHVVVGLLGVVSIATIALLILSLIRQRNLQYDPSTIASVMALVADSQPLLSDLAKVDCCTMEDVQGVIGCKRYKLVHDGTGSIITTFVASEEPNQQALDNPASIAKPVRPIEFSRWVALPFIALFIILAVLLGIIYSLAHLQGLPLPSSNTIVQNLLENYTPTALATMIEPMWILINRLLCMLQPLEELRSCNAKARKSIELDYSSLPPQLVVFKALKSRHFVLAAVCAMALLANLLAVAFAGLFNQKSIDIQYPTSFRPPLDFKFVHINGSIGPSDVGEFGSTVISGAYRGGDGRDQFLIADSNHSRNTSLPAWTDDKMFYLPVFSEGPDLEQSNATRFEAKTKALGATLDCKQLQWGKNFVAKMKVEVASITVNISSDSGNVVCYNREYMPIQKCINERSALEMTVALKARENSTQHEADVCMGSIVMGWIRGPQGKCLLEKDTPLGEDNTIFVHCQPRLITGTASIQFNAAGRLQHPADDIVLDANDADPSPRLFSNDPINLIGQSNLYLFRGTFAYAWHNETGATDPLNYFMIHENNSTQLVDPNQPVPTFDDVVVPLNKAYSKLFAIWLGRNRKNLFVPINNDEAPLLEGYQIHREQRLFLSPTMFIISEAILCTYVIVAIWVYTRRPGQYLPRLPTSIAAVVALFAASAAVQDMTKTSHLDKKGRMQHLERVDARYGYGNFIGADGRVHIGIEKVPFVRTRMKTTWLEQKLPLFRKGYKGSVQ